MFIRPIRLIVLLAAILAATSASGQNWPSRPVTVIVPYAAGGSVDVVARVVATKLGERLGQTVIIENVAGAGGVTGHFRHVCTKPLPAAVLASNGQTWLVVSWTVAFASAGTRCGMSTASDPQGNRMSVHKVAACKPELNCLGEPPPSLSPWLS